MKLPLQLALNAEDTFHSPGVPVVSTESSVQFSQRYLLVCEANSTNLSDGIWRFSLETADGEQVFSAEDTEMGDLNRLSLLAAVRGLESIEGPSSVTLVSNNRYLIRSLSDSLPRWRQNDFTWEHFGHRVDVQHADLWRRIDRAIQIHRVEACLVSTRLISTGQPVPACQHSAADGKILRVDQSHGMQAGDGLAPPPKRRRGARPESTPSEPNDAKVSRFRRWLMDGQSDVEDQPVKRRFTSEDLLEHA